MLFAALFSSLVLAATPSPVVKPTLLVAPLKAVNVSQVSAEILSEDLRTYAGRSERFTLVTPEEMAAVDKELARQLSGGCNEASCIAELGGALGAQFMIAGVVSQVGGRVSINLKLIDITTVTAQRVSAQRAESIELLQDRMGSIMRGLLGEQVINSEQAKRRKNPSPRSSLLKSALVISGVLGGVVTGMVNAGALQPRLDRALIADAMIVGTIALVIYVSQ